MGKHDNSPQRLDNTRNEIASEDSPPLVLASAATKSRCLRQRPNIMDENTSNNTIEDSNILDAIVQPFVLKTIWLQLKGKEFDEPHMVDRLVQMALQVVFSSTGEWI